MALSNNQLNEFAVNGYTVVHNAIPAALLKKLRNLFEEKMSRCNENEVAVNFFNDSSYITNIEQLFKSDNLACLELLGFPLILESAETICGPDFFLIQEFAVIKMLGDNTEVLWHQDMLHRRTGNCCIMGIYLDDANAGDGCLRAIPQSHTSEKSICLLKEEPFVEIPVKAGDILIHDMMLAHSSGVLKNNALRRVLYFEFISHAQALAESIYTEEQVYNRMRLTRLAIDHYQYLHPEGKKFEWKNPLAVPAVNIELVHATVADIHRAKSLGKPSAYCFENAEP